MKWITTVFFFVCVITVSAQNSSFNLKDYKAFLSSHQNLATHDLYSIYDAGKFKASVDNLPSNILYLDSIKTKMNLTSYELDLLKTNGFFVTERIKNDFINMFHDIWVKDLPVFVTSDAILYALHRSYDLMLKSIEINFLIPKLTEVLNTLHDNFGLLEQKYSGSPEMITYLKDADLYLTVPRKILQDNSSPYYSNNSTTLNHFLDNISGLSLVEEPIFGKTFRYVDYSQFQVRGHYTDEYHPQLAKYFQAMMWLGRIELYLVQPKSANTDTTVWADVQRQTIDSYLISELIKLSGVQASIDEIENTIHTFVGDQDNVTLKQLNDLTGRLQINSASALTDGSILKTFQDSLSVQPYAGQKILSQVLESDPFTVDAIVPASAFLLFGQRFVVDSYVTGNVVFDKIIFNNKKVTRMLPSTLDILFSIGNSASAQILQPELDKYHYATNLASLRYLIDSYTADFWNSSIYNLWLNSIRTLNPPQDRSNLPEFMQTAAWWQQKMNTQLASWTELRHDNLLYAKQSYTGMITCSYPYGYVEPIPSFYNAMKNFATLTSGKLSALPFQVGYEVSFLNGFAAVMDTLETIAEKELNKKELSDQEKMFLQSVLYTKNVACGADPLDGWYYKKLTYHSYFVDMPQFIVADYHTAPTDEYGSTVGWVKHSGTGPANLCVVVANISNVGNVVFAGPVSSYYEYTTTNFKRLTDEEWNSTYLKQSLRPDWVNVYLANSNGESRGSGSMLITDVRNNFQSDANLFENFVLLQNYPNPFNLETTIRFSIPSKLANSFSELKIYNINGQLIKKIFSREIPAGNYLVKWDGRNDVGQIVSSGVYIYQLKIGQVVKSGKMSLLK